jgi:sugar/nucleoside kinase (ribokinase family)
VPIDFLAIGNLTRDTTPQGFRLGGTVSFAAFTARRLGWRPGVLTRASLDGLEPDGRPEKAGTRRTTGLPGTPLAGIPVHLMPSPVTTTFTNIYTERGRTQVIEAVADPVTPDGLPSEWAETPVVLLGSIAREIPPSWAELFPLSLLGIAPQGHMRSWDAAGHVFPARWENAGPLLRRADAVIVSREDVGGDDAYIAELAAQTKLLIVTDGWHGATVYENGEATRIPARAAREVDPTGAGDVFAASFLLRLAETRDSLVAARFANVVASLSIEAPGMDAIPTRAEVENWLAEDAAASSAAVAGKSQT